MNIKTLDLDHHVDLAISSAWKGRCNWKGLDPLSRLGETSRNDDRQTPLLLLGYLAAILQLSCSAKCGNTSRSEGAHSFPGTLRQPSRTHNLRGNAAREKLPCCSPLAASAPPRASTCGAR